MSHLTITPRKTRISGSPILAESRHFIVKIAETPQELESAQKLRYTVFRQEQRRFHLRPTGYDRDGFDSVCAHLLVLERDSSRVVGTYRMRSGAMTGSCSELYSSQEYDLSSLEPYRERLFEMGRSCVAPEYRSGAVVALLWAGIAEIRRRIGFDYMLGCVSLEHTIAPIGAAIHRELRQRELLSAGIHAEPKASYRLPECVPAEINFEQELPPLFKGYLRIGAKIAGEPVIDREFGSIDFLVWFDFKTLPEKYARHFGV